MSILREKRWTKMKKFFDALSTAIDKDGIVVMFDGELLEHFIFNVIDEEKCAQFDHTRNGCTFGLFLDIENDTKTSAASIIKEIKSRIKIYKHISY